MKTLENKYENTTVKFNTPDNIPHGSPVVVIVEGEYYIEVIRKKAKDINAHSFEENVEETFKYDSEVKDIISKPEHYMLSDGLEVKDVVEMIINNPNSNLNKYESHMKAVILEYLMRAENKNGLEDYKKAGQWLVWLIESLEGETK